MTNTLEPGMAADVRAVAGHPLEDVAPVHDVVAVYARGVPVPNVGRSDS